jgi:hypothetical protein
VAGRARLGEARGERTGQAATNAILYGSCDAQPVQVTIGVQGGWIQATIRDQGRPPSRTAPLMSLRGRGLWLIGQLVDELRLAKARPGMLVPLRQCISLGDSAGSARRVARWSGRHQRVTTTTWLTTRRRGLTDRGSLCRGALANAAHRRLLTRVVPSEVLGDIPQRPSSNSPNSQVGKDDIGQHLWQPDLRPCTDEGEQAVPGKRRHPVGGFQPVTIFGP